ncbi:MAG: DUF4124 domain-containing protein [Gammaproteobacteria bacterium]|nr:DUF4124 domain-containing protein [Gammaproteobacteria bacterium]HXK56383.1 DUF4124 domain-containing protein [Gammaproteobacteria bacterium]
MRTGILLLTVSGLLAVSGVQAEIYRWVDEQGKVHFSDRPNRGGAQRLELSAPLPDTSGVEQERLEAERKMQRERLLDAYREEREARQLERLKAEETERQRAANCAYARNLLRKYGNARLYQPLEDGSRRYLDSVERQREIERAQASVQRWCDS